MRQVVAIVIVGCVVALLIGGYAPALLQSPRPDVVEGPDAWLFPGWQKRVGEAPLVASKSAGLIAEVNRRLAKRGVRLVVLVVPMKARAFPNRLPAGQPAFTSSADYSAWVRDLRGRGVITVDALPVLRRPSAGGEPSFPAHDEHWSAEAAERVALHVAATVRDQGWTPSFGGRGQALGPWRTERRETGIVRQLRRKGDLRFGEESFPVREYTAPAEGPASVILVGNSFSGTTYGLARRLSAELERKSDIVVEFDVDGPWKAMGGALRREWPPGVLLVWQIGEDSLTDPKASAALEVIIGTT